MIKQLPVAYAMVLICSIGIAIWVHDIIKTPERDLFNASALVLEAGFGLIISWTVYVYSKKWKVENEIISKNIKLALEETKNQQNQLIHRRWRI